MKPSEVEKFYQRACGVRHNTPQVEEGREWAKILRDIEQRDADVAISNWWASTETDSKGDLKSNWLPAPADLKRFVYAAINRRRVASAEHKDLVRWQCPDCGRFACGFLSHGFDGPPLICSGFAREGGLCGSVMNEVYHEGRGASC